MVIHFVKNFILHRSWVDDVVKADQYFWIINLGTVMSQGVSDVVKYSDRLEPHLSLPINYRCLVLGEDCLPYSWWVSPANTSIKYINYSSQQKSAEYHHSNTNQCRYAAQDETVLLIFCGRFQFVDNSLLGVSFHFDWAYVQLQYEVEGDQCSLVSVGGSQVTGFFAFSLFDHLGAASPARCWSAGRVVLSKAIAHSLVGLD